MKKDFMILGQLVKRSLKLFLKDKAGVFFSLLAPLIILLVYVLFLGDMQIEAVKAALQNLPVGDNTIQGFVDGWMLAGVIAVACITVSFSAQVITVKDRENNTISDTLAAPVKRSIVTIGNFVANYVVTVVIVLIVTAISFIYLAITGWNLSAGDTLAILGTILISALSACLLSTIICRFVKSTNAHGALVGVLSAAIGFLIGAYMPMSMFPKVVQYIALFVPGTYSSGMLRNYFMQGALGDIAAVSPQAADALSESYALGMDFFGIQIDTVGMLGVFLATIALCLAALVAIECLSSRNALRPIIRLNKHRNND